MAKILFRTSGGRIPKKELGLGHIFRCINLSKELKSYEIHFLIEDFGSVSSILQEHRIKKISNLLPGITTKSDIQKTSDYIIKNQIDLLIIDKFGITNEFVKKLREIVKVIIISDLKKVSFDADLIVNGFIGFDNKIIKNRYGTKCLVGPKYQILNKKYKKQENFKKKYDLLVTLGGFDANNLLEIILQKISKFDKMKMKMIMGPATKKNSKIQKLSKKCKNVKIIDKTNNLKKEIGSSKFGICGGGITTYEFASLDVPFAIVCQYKHQIITAREWQKRNIGKNLGFIQNNDKKIELLLKQIINNKNSKISNKVMDGFGSERVAKEISKIIKK